jgi:hypothetical protein
MSATELFWRSVAQGRLPVALPLPGGGLTTVVATLETQEQREFVLSPSPMVRSAALCLAAADGHVAQRLASESA